MRRRVDTPVRCWRPIARSPSRRSSRVCCSVTAPPLSGEVEVVDIGLDVSRATSHLVDAGDVAAWFPRRPVDAHKWSTAVRIVAGSPGMLGAAGLAARGAARCGAGLVAVSSPGGDAPVPLEVLQPSLPDTEWADEVLDGLARYRALVVGPGLGRASATVASIRRVISRSTLPVVADGDALHAIATGDRRAAPLRDRARRPSSPRTTASSSSSPARRLRADRIEAARSLASPTRVHRVVEGSGDRDRRPDGRRPRRRPRRRTVGDRRFGRRARRDDRRTARR